MGFIGKVLSFIRVVRGDTKTSDVKVSTGGDVNLTVDHFSDVGDDSQPLPDDYTALVSHNGEGRLSAVGYIDPANEQKSNAGEKRIYARDSNGAQVVELWLKNDGSAILSNGTGKIELLANGNVVLNTVVIDVAGNISTPASITTPSAVVNGKQLAEHIHISAAPGTPTGPNL